MNDATSSQRRLLIVDDDRSLSTILAWGFEDLGYLVSTAHDCRSAAIAAHRAAFDFALLDYRLPDGTGHELAAQLGRTQPRLQIVLMSADRGAAVAEINEPPRAAAFVEKPIRLNRLDAFFNAAGGPLPSPA